MPGPQAKSPWRSATSCRIVCKRCSMTHRPRAWGSGAEGRTGGVRAPDSRPRTPPETRCPHQPEWLSRRRGDAAAAMVAAVVRISALGLLATMAPPVTERQTAPPGSSVSPAKRRGRVFCPVPSSSMPGMRSFSEVQVLYGVGNQTVTRRQGRHREVGSEGSRSHSHDPTNRNRIGGHERWVSWLETVKPEIPKIGSW
jgi:hypothetical protein